MKLNGHFSRLLFVGVFFATLIAILIWRVLDLTVLHRQFLKGQGDARSIRTQSISAYRGMVMDRNGVPLAVSTPVQSIFVNPKTFSPEPQTLRTLSRLLNISEKVIQSKVKEAMNREFIFLKRQIEPERAKKIEELNIPGLGLQEEFRRFYPEGETMAQLLGFTNIDDNGIEGLELAYDDWLKGISGKKRILKDRMGRVIEEMEVLREPKSGRDLVLSIDRRIQYLAYQELKNTLESFNAKQGSIVVLDANNGEILALANAPSFNPNARERYTRASYRNRAVTDVFEPGSVIKPFSIASALASGRIRKDTIIDTRPSVMTVNGKVIRDVHNYGVLDVTGVLQHSSNIGVTRMTLLSPPEQLIGLLLRSGFSERTESGYPGEAEGSLVKPKDANPFVHATLSFGYGVSVSALQLARAYQIFANQGTLIPVTFVKGASHGSPKKVLDTKTANDVLLMMEAVLGNEGTGQNARISGYRVAGKTGTARIASKKGGYEEKKHIASFVGIAPVSRPRLIVVVVVHEPSKKSYYGAQVAAPLFSKVMSQALHILDIPPDNEEIS